MLLKIDQDSLNNSSAEMNHFKTRVGQRRPYDWGIGWESRQLFMDIESQSF